MEKIYFKKFNYNRKILNKKKGFTLVETLVAVSIFTVSILGLLSVLSKGINDTNYVKRKIIAGYLAQEGIEYVKNVRDSFVLYSFDPQTGWNNFNAKLNSASCFDSDGCYFNDNILDYNDNFKPITNINFMSCSGDCPSLSYDSSDAKYKYVIGFGSESDFIRKIEATVINSNEIKIFSTVYWNQGSGQHSIMLSDTLFNWIE